MDANFDLLGDPIPEGFGRRGRPQHVPTSENRNKVMQLLAFNWTIERIAHALAITDKTLNRHYFRELRVRIEARDRLEATLVAMTWEAAKAGNVAAMKEYRKLIERHDQRLAAESFGADTEAGRPSKLGKKEIAAQESRSAGEGTDWGDDLASAVRRPN